MPGLIGRWFRRRRSPRAIQICNGLGAGNIGDEIMARAFWAELPPSSALDVEVLPNYASHRAPYPEGYRLLPVGWDGSPLPEGDFTLGLLVGDTPVTEDLSLDWPLRFLAARLDAVRDLGAELHAVGVGVDRLRSPEARALFDAHFRGIRSWSVRSTACRDALVDLGVAPETIAVGADWAWLYRTEVDKSVWAHDTWKALGVDPDAPLLVANAVNERWLDATAHQKALAAALDEIGREEGAQIAFFCQECRSEVFYDREASRRVMQHMTEPAVVVPNEYYSADETMALLSYASATLSQRYHYTVASVLAGTVPVNILRGQKMAGLNRDLGLPDAGRMGEASSDLVVERLRDALRNRAAWTSRLEETRARLRERALSNLTFVREALGEGGRIDVG